MGANVRGRDPGSFVGDVKRAIEGRVLCRPVTGLKTAEYSSSSSRLAVVVPLTLFLIIGLLVLAGQSVRAAAAIFSGVPFAFTGGVLAPVLRGIPFSISAAVGFNSAIRHSRFERARDGRVDP